MANLTFPTDNAQINTDSHDFNIDTFEKVRFTDRQQLYWNGTQSNLWEKQIQSESNAYLSLDGQHIESRQDGLYIDGTLVLTYLNKRAITHPRTFKTNAIRAISIDSNFHVIGLKVSGTNATLVDLTDTTIPEVNFTIQNLSTATRFGIAQGAHSVNNCFIWLKDSINIVIGGPTVISRLLYRPMTDDIVVVAHPTGVYITEQWNDIPADSSVNLYGTTYRYDFDGTYHIYHGSYGFYSEGKHYLTVRHTLTSRTGAEVSAGFNPLSFQWRNITDNNWNQVEYYGGAAQGDQVYSEQYFPLEPFIIVHDTSNNYWWVLVNQNSIPTMEATQGDPTATPPVDPKPTVDFNRRQIDQTYWVSDITSQFNRKVQVSGTEAVHLIYFRGQQAGISVNNVLIFPFGYLTSWQYFKNNNHLYFIFDEQILVEVDPNIPPMLSKLSDTLYKISYDDVNNLYDTITRTVYPGSVDWSNFIEPGQVIPFSFTRISPTAESVMFFNSGYGANFEVLKTRSSSILTGSTQLQTCTDTFDRIYFSPTWFIWGANPRDYNIPIDYYYTKVSKDSYSTLPIYQETSGITRDYRLANITYPEPNAGTVIVPAPVNAEYSPNNTKNLAAWYSYVWGCVGVTNNSNSMDSFFISSDLPQGGDLFFLALNLYSFDGESVYSLGTTDGTKTFTARAEGMLLVGVDTTSAYFYSKYDKSLYVFTGEQRLSRSISLSGIPIIKAGTYAQAMDSLALLTDTYVICIRGNQMYQYKPKLNNNQILTRIGYWNGGIVVYSDTVIHIPAYYKIDDSYSSLPFKLKTSWQGSGQTNEFKIDDVRFSFYDSVNANIKTSIETMSTKSLTSTIRDFKLTAGDTDSKSGRSIVSMVPDNPVGLAFRLTIESDDIIHIDNIDLIGDGMDKTAVHKVSAPTRFPKARI